MGVICEVGVAKYSKAVLIRVLVGDLYCGFKIHHGIMDFRNLTLSRADLISLNCSSVMLSKSAPSISAPKVGWTFLTVMVLNVVS